MEAEKIREKIDTKTKPLGALGQLEELAFQVAMVQRTDTPKLKAPTILVFAADHGIAAHGVSAYPPEVTAQMVQNFLQGGAAINVFSRQHRISLHIVDSGVNAVFSRHPLLYPAKVRRGTRNMLEEPAMTPHELEQCFRHARRLMQKVAKTGCNIVGFGEMGIGNTSSASLLMATLCRLPLRDCAGRGTGLNDTQYDQKLHCLQQVQQVHHPDPEDAQAVLATFGGYEIAQMAAAMLAAYDHRMLFLVDGFIATAAYLVGQTLRPEIAGNAIFTHQSGEKGHQRLLDYLQARPLLQLGLRLGEGTGCALAYPLVVSAVGFMNEMASFRQAAVSEKR